MAAVSGDEPTCLAYPKSTHYTTVTTGIVQSVVLMSLFTLMVFLQLQVHPQVTRLLAQVPSALCYHVYKHFICERESNADYSLHNQ